MAEEKDKDTSIIADDDATTGMSTSGDLNIDTTDIFDDSATFKIDKGLGLTAGTISGKPMDHKAINDYLAKIEKPASGSVYDKMAARYRSQGEGAVLRTQKNLENLFLPTINLIQEREAAAQARFTLLKDKMPEFDDSTIFGAQSGNEIPILDEVKNISTSVKEDLRMLSRLNPADERYDEIKKRVQKNQDSIVNFDKINKQLLKMRNAGTDESQWSKGMDETTANMWRDIYTSNGKNIKIVDGKLIWTDTKGVSKYQFKGGRYDDDKYEALGGFDTVLGNLAFRTRNSDGEQYTFENGEKNGTVKDVQKVLIEGGFTDADGNELDPDGEWGPKSQAAYDKYLEQKDELETAWLDENLTDKQKKKHQVTTGVGETKTINLNEIGDGPITIDGKATNMDRVIQGEVQKFIEMDGKVDDPMYSTMIKSKLFELNKIGPQGIKSLIFDGIGTDDDDLFTGMNTDSFIKSVIGNHYGEKLSESEIERHIDMMRSGDVTQMYKDESGKKTTLQSQFMKWYKGEIDNKITEGRKSKVVAAAGGKTTTSSGDPSRDDSGGSGFYKSGVNFTYGARNSTEISYSDKTLNGGDLLAGEIGLTGNDIASIVGNNSKLSKIFKKDVAYNSEDYKIDNNNVLKYLSSNDGEWYTSPYNVDSKTPENVIMYNHIMENIKQQVESKGGTLDYKKGAEFKDIKSRKDQAGVLNSYDFNESLSDYNSDGGRIYRDIIDLNKGDGDALVTQFNNKYNKYGFYAKTADDRSDHKLSDEVMNSSEPGERMGEGVLRIYYRKPQNGEVYNEDTGKIIYDPKDFNGSGSYIDVLHDSYSNDRKNQNLSYLIDFMEAMHGQSDVQKYWDEEIKYTSKGKEVGSDYAGEITY